MGTSKSQSSMGRCPGQNAGMLCRLCCIQGPTSPDTWKSIINKTIPPPPPKSSQNPKNALWLARFLDFQFSSCLQEKAILTQNQKSKLIHFNISNPKSSSFYSSKPSPHLYTCLFSLPNICHSLKSLGDKSAWTPDENTCRIIFNNGSIHSSSSLHREKKKRINQAWKYLHNT